MTYLQNAYLFKDLPVENLPYALACSQVIHSIPGIDEVSGFNLNDGKVFHFDSNRHPLLPCDWFTYEVTVKFDPNKPIDELECNFNWCEIKMDIIDWELIISRDIKMEWGQLVELLKLIHKSDISSVLATHKCHKYEEYCLEEVIQQNGVLLTEESYDAYEKFRARKVKFKKLLDLRAKTEKDSGT